MRREICGTQGESSKVLMSLKKAPPTQCAENVTHEETGVIPGPIPFSTSRFPSRPFGRNFKMAPFISEISHVITYRFTLFLCNLSTSCHGVYMTKCSFNSFQALAWTVQLGTVGSYTRELRHRYVATTTPSLTENKLIMIILLT